MQKLRSLPLVKPADELAGVAPLALERAAARAALGDAVHRGLLRTCASIARHALTTTAPPRATLASLAALELAEAWADGLGDEVALKKARNDAFNALGRLEQITEEAIRAALAQLERRDSTAIDARADQAVVRWARLGAHYAGSSVVLCLDGVATPRELASVPQQAAGAVAYFKVGLGAARSPELRRRATEQAAWEHERGMQGDENALSIDVFHEFLGASWKDTSDAYRAHYFDFAEWALPRGLASS